MTTREAFEAWMRDRGETYLFRRDAPKSERLGQYCRLRVQDQWETWQAALAAHPSASPESAEAIGWKLAMRVLQSDLYAELDDSERAECDALTRANPYTYPLRSVPVAEAVEYRRTAFEEIRSALDETYGFASTSPRGQENINFALGKLDEIEQALATPPAADSRATEQMTVCCGRTECGGECGNEWQGMRDAVPDMRDAYVGAREDLAIWKRRALEAEDLNRKFAASVNGPTFMGEPVCDHNYVVGQCTKCGCVHAGE